MGSGPFPTEEEGDIGNYLRKKGVEYGTTTGRPRRCGWLDIVALKYSVMINSIDSIVITKLDVLSGLKNIKIATSYSLLGKKILTLPTNEDDWLKIKPHYLTLPGWQEDITQIKQFNSLPPNCQRYIRKIESLLKIRIKYISVGPDRKQTIVLN